MDQTRSARLRQRVAELHATDAEVRGAEPDPVVTEAINRPGLRLRELIATVFDAYADRPALARRASELVVDQGSGARIRRLLPSYDTISYRELGERMRAVASAWRHDPHLELGTGDFVATLGFTSIDYAVVDLACAEAGVVTVPLQASASVAQLSAILAETEPTVLAVGLDSLPHALDCVLDGVAPRAVHVFDYDPELDDHRAVLGAVRARLTEAGSSILLETLAELEERGRDLPPVPADDRADDNPLTLLVYTSGSTGPPRAPCTPSVWWRSCGPASCRWPPSISITCR